jgi:hypothetical protein
MGEGFGAGHVDRHRDYAAENASKKRSDPRRAIFAPDQDAVAFDDSSFFQERGEAAAHFGEGFIGGYLFAQAVPGDDGDLVAVPLEVVDERCKMWPQNASL